MEIEIEKEKETPLLSRKRVTAWVYYQGATPSRKEVLKEFAKKLNVDTDKIIIKHMYTRFGQMDLKLIANVYNDRETLEKLETKSHIEKNKLQTESSNEQAAEE